MIFYKWNSSCLKDKTNWCPVLSEVPTGLFGFGAGEVNGCPFWDDFYSCLLLSVRCLVSVHSQQTEPYVFTHTGVWSETAAPDSSASTCLGLSTVFRGHLGSEGRNSGFGRCLWWLGVSASAQKSHFVTACEMVPTLTAWNWSCVEQGDEVLFYRPDLHEEHLGETQLRDIRL